MERTEIANFRLRIPDGIPGRDQVTFDWKQAESWFQHRNGELVLVIPVYGRELVIHDGIELDAETATMLINFLRNRGGQHAVVL